ncbi:hypothetical protein C8F01DRAFT_465179 [Mycena amicta]|nr:hypothetical protein C8F01DRAFT_465179 [Mycena amicta]
MCCNRASCPSNSTSCPACPAVPHTALFHLIRPPRICRLLQGEAIPFPLAGKTEVLRGSPRYTLDFSHRTQGILRHLPAAEECRRRRCRALHHRRACQTFQIRRARYRTAHERDPRRRCRCSSRSRRHIPANAAEHPAVHLTTRRDTGPFGDHRALRLCLAHRPSQPQRAHPGGHQDATRRGVSRPCGLKSTRCTSPCNKHNSPRNRRRRRLTSARLLQQQHTFLCNKHNSPRNRGRPSSTSHAFCSIPNLPFFWPAPEI